MGNKETLTQPAETLPDIEAGFDALILEFEKRIANLNPEILEFVGGNFQEIVDAFVELKDNFRQRLSKVSSERTKQIPEAMQELGALFEVIFDVLENDFENYSVVNQTREGSQEIVSSVLKKNIDKDTYYELVFNFEKTDVTQPRVKIRHSTVRMGREISCIRIDRDDERGGIFL